MNLDLPELHHPGGSKYGLRDRVSANLDKAIETVSGPNDRFLWEVSCPLVPQISPAGMAVQMNTWLTLVAPSPILSEGWILSAAKCDVPGLATDPDLALNIVRQLVENLRRAAAAKLDPRANGHPG